MFKQCNKFYCLAKKKHNRLHNTSSVIICTLKCDKYNSICQIVLRTGYCCFCIQMHHLLIHVILDQICHIYEIESTNKKRGYLEQRSRIQKTKASSMKHTLRRCVLIHRTHIYSCRDCTIFEMLCIAKFL